MPHSRPHAVLYLNTIDDLILIAACPACSNAAIGLLATWSSFEARAQISHLSWKLFQMTQDVSADGSCNTHNNFMSRFVCQERIQSIETTQLSYTGDGPPLAEVLLFWMEYCVSSMHARSIHLKSLIKRFSCSSQGNRIPASVDVTSNGPLGQERHGFCFAFRVGPH